MVNLLAIALYIATMQGVYVPNIAVNSYTQTEYIYNIDNAIEDLYVESMKPASAY